MELNFTLNGKPVAAQIAPDTLLIDLVRSLGCASVKRGCDTANCGLCTLFLDDKPVLSCSLLAARVEAVPSPPWKGFRRKRRSLWDSLPTRAPTSAASATPAL